MNTNIFTCTKDNAQHTYQFPWRNFTHLLKERAQNTPDKPALIFHDCDTDARQVITYTEFERQTAALAGHLHRDYNIQPGDCVSLALPNCAEIPLLTLALFRLGATSVPLDLAKDVPERKRYKIENSKSKLLVVLPEHADSEREHIPDIQIATTTDLLAANAPDADLEPEWSGNATLEQDPNIVLYTSGTTGHPKGVLLTRQSITSNADGIIRWLDFDENERLNLVLPLHHINSTIFSITSFMVGGTLILNSRYSVSAFWRVIAQEQATSTSIVPTIMADLLSRKEEADAHDTSSLKKIMIGSAPVPAKVAFASCKDMALQKSACASRVCPPHCPQINIATSCNKTALVPNYQTTTCASKVTHRKGNPVKFLFAAPWSQMGTSTNPKPPTKSSKTDGFIRVTWDFIATYMDTVFILCMGAKKKSLSKAGSTSHPSPLKTHCAMHSPKLQQPMSLAFNTNVGEKKFVQPSSSIHPL
jgi:acyl-CoA synthetase (AMP-forming)/AMP-acid ligase II